MSQENQFKPTRSSLASNESSSEMACLKDYPFQRILYPELGASSSVLRKGWMMFSTPFQGSKKSRDFPSKPRLYTRLRLVSLKLPEGKENVTGLEKQGVKTRLQRKTWHKVSYEHKTMVGHKYLQLHLCH